MMSNILFVLDTITYIHCISGGVERKSNEITFRPTIITYTRDRRKNIRQSLYHYYLTIRFFRDKRLGQGDQSYRDGSTTWYLVSILCIQSYNTDQESAKSAKY